MDRYDELMLGLYQGFVPPWLPARSRELYQRESLRRRCALGQSLVMGFRCTMYAARSRLGEDFSQEVYAAWPATRDRAQNVMTGLYLALQDALRAHPGAEVLLELAHFEALAVAEVVGAPALPRVEPEQVRARGFEALAVYRFEYPVPKLQARMMLYAGAEAPASFARDLEVAPCPTFVGRMATPRGWAVRDLSPHFNAPLPEAPHVRAAAG